VLIFYSISNGQALMPDNETFEINLITHAYGGESLGRLPDGRAVFVPYALPGEKVRIRLVESKRGYGRGELLEVLDAAPERITPRCPHFCPLEFEGKLCGGCHYQHLSYEDQLQVKTDILRDQLERIGKLESPNVIPAIPSPQPWYYRNHVQFHLSADGKPGYQAPRSHYVVPIRECHLPEEPINQLWPLLDMETIPGLDRVAIRLGTGEDLLVVLESSNPEPFDFSVDLPVSVVHKGPGGSLVLVGDDHILMDVAGCTFRVGAASFFQINTEMAAKMVAYLLSHLPLTPQTTLIDAYCGVGLFSAFLAPKIDRLVGIEASSSAADDFVLNMDEFENVSLYEAPVENVLPQLDLQAEIILVDPPRKGLGQRTLDGILKLEPAFLAYISCDPATLGRDARRLVSGGYQLSQITPFDLFPQTSHIESISFWTKEGKAP
jgi:23S rRNA (uracil1939-C5)-methyltransferase